MTWCKTVTVALSLALAWYAITGKPITQRLILIAGVISVVWVTWYNYDYKSPDQLKFGRLNVMTWVVWTMGLLAVGLWWMYLAENTELCFEKRLIITAILWTVCMMIVEYIGYNWMKIQLKSNYTGLFGLNLMHGPDYLKVYYLSVWALYLFLVEKL